MMTWLQFKEWVEDQGIKDGDPVDYIHVVETEIFPDVTQAKRCEQGWWIA